MRKWIVVLLGIALMAGIFSGIVFAVNNENDEVSVQPASGTYYLHGQKVWHSEDVRMNGWTIYLEKLNEGTGEWELIATTETATYNGEEGKYYFRNLTAGKYRITEEDRPGWYLVETWPATPDGVHYVELNHPSVGPYTFCNDKLPPEVEPLTPGYWKTHSRYGPAPYDDTWAEIGEDTMFFLSNQSYYEVLWTEPRGGNAYYILAHAYIAAELNLVNGVNMPPAVQSAFDEATNLFCDYSPSDVGAWRGEQGERALFINLAEILDDFNNGREISSMEAAAVENEPEITDSGSKESDSDDKWFENIGSKDNDQGPKWFEDVGSSNRGNSGKRWFE